MAHTDISSGTRGLFSALSLHLHSYCVYASSKRFGKSAPFAQVRAVIVIDNIDVSIKKSCDIHIDTENWISILIDNWVKQNRCFLPGCLHHGGLNQASILNVCMHQTF